MDFSDWFTHRLVRVLCSCTNCTWRCPIMKMNSELHSLAKSMRTHQHYTYMWFVIILFQNHGHWSAVHSFGKVFHGILDLTDAGRSGPARRQRPNLCHSNGVEVRAAPDEMAVPPSTGEGNTQLGTVWICAVHLYINRKYSWMQLQLFNLDNKQNIY